MPDRNGNRIKSGMRRQHGIAIVTVLLVVALAATLAASVVWRELIAVRDVENQRLAIEAIWAERAAIEWARVTLRNQQGTSNITYVGQAWSEPVKNVQIADFLPRGALGVNSDLANAYLSGYIEDAQAKFNLQNLVSRSSANGPWQINAKGLAAYERLLEALALPSRLAGQTGKYMVNSLGNGSGGNWPLQLVTIDDLIRVPGYDAKTVKTLSPYLTILPELTTININTAEEPALMAAFPALSIGQAHSLAQRRATAYFNYPDEAALVVPDLAIDGAISDEAIAGINSGYFIVHCRIHSAKINQRIETLIARYGSGQFGWTSILWTHRLAG